MSAENLVQRMTDTDDQSNLCAVLRATEGGIQALLVADEKGRWSIPGGHAKENETPEDACKREVKEETGLEVEVEPLFLADHVARDLPVTLFYAIVDEDADPQPGGGDVTKVRWVAVSDLGDLNGTDRLAIQVAANRVHNPQEVVDDAVGVAETQGFAVAAVAAPPVIAPGIHFRINGPAAEDYARQLSMWAESLDWPLVVVKTTPYESTVSMLERASARRKLTPLLEGIILVSDARWRYESDVLPLLVKGVIVIEVGPEPEMQRLLERGLSEDLWIQLGQRLPKPKTLFTVGESFDLNEFQVLKDAIEQMKSTVCRKCGHTFEYGRTPEAGMGWVICPSCAVAIDQTGKVVEAIDPDDPGGVVARAVRAEKGESVEIVCPHCGFRRAVEKIWPDDADIRTDCPSCGRIHALGAVVKLE
jgi:ADP-ribose pyrophosphatase YjhB (NUDIX family)